MNVARGARCAPSPRMGRWTAFGLAISTVFLNLAGCPGAGDDSLPPDPIVAGDQAGNSSGNQTLAETIVVGVFKNDNLRLNLARDVSGSAFEIVAEPSHGELTWRSTSTGVELTYTPPQGFIGRTSAGFIWVRPDGSSSDRYDLDIHVYPRVRFDVEVEDTGTALAVIARAFTPDDDPLPTGDYVWRFDFTQKFGGAQESYVFSRTGEHLVALTVTLAGMATFDAQVGPSGSDTEAYINASGYRISGRVLTSGGDPVPNVAMRATSGGISDTTGADGRYSISVPSGWSGRITPNHSSYRFVPQFRNFVQLLSDAQDQDFIAASIDMPDGEMDPIAGLLAVEPLDGWNPSGVAGSEFNLTRSFTLRNIGEAVFNWQVATNEDWVSMTPASGTLESGATVNVIARLTPAAGTLSIGNHEAVISFVNVTTQAGSTVRPVKLTVNETTAPGRLIVDLPIPLQASGPRNGPFNPSEREYTIWNDGGTSLNWSVTRSVDWLSVTPASGSLAPGAQAKVRVTFNALANALAVGAHSGEVHFRNDTTGEGGGNRTVTLTVQGGSSNLYMFNTGSAGFSGPAGGPFEPSSRSYSLVNLGERTLNWTVTSSKVWVTASPSSGTLEPGKSVAVQVSTASGATALPVGNYDGVLTFTNQTDPQTLTRAVTLAVQEPTTPGSLNVSDGNAFSASGPIGGPFSQTKTYTLTNTGQQALSWSASKSASWVTLTGTSGALQPGQTAQVTVSINSGANGLAAGSYSDTVSFTNTTNGGGNTTRGVSLTITATPGALNVSDGNGFTSNGNAGGPFNPISKTYTLTNTGQASINWSASRSGSWTTVTPASGSLTGGQSAQVTVSINSNANALAAGTHTDALQFSNATNGGGSTSRPIVLNVTANGGSATIYTPPNTSRIAPYTALFSGLDSVSPVNDPIVRWDWDFGDNNSADPRYDEGVVVAHRFDNPGTYTVRLTVVLASGATATTTQNVTVSAFGGNTYYVDATNGNDAYTETEARNNPSKPWRTLSRATSAAVRSQNNPCKVLLKRGEVWNQGTSSWTPPRPSIVDAYGTGALPRIEFTGHTSRVQWTGGGGTDHTQYGYGVILQNLHIKRDLPWQNGYDYLVVAYHKGSVVRNCVLENGGGVDGQQNFLVVEDNEIFNGGARGGGAYAATSDVVFRRNVVRQVGREYVHAHGIYFHGGENNEDPVTKRPTTRHWLIEYNTFRDCANLCIGLYKADGVVVRGNDLRSNGNFPNTDAPGGGRGEGNAFSLSSCWRSVFEHNLIGDMTGNQGYRGFIKSSGDWSIIRNNVWTGSKNELQFNNPDSGLFGSGATIFANNTMIGDAGSMVSMSASHVASGRQALFINNVVMNTSSSSSAIVKLSNGAPGWSFDFNRYHSPNNTNTAFNGGNFNTWRSSGRDAGGSNGNPLINTSTFELQSGSPCRHAGSSSPYIWIDYDGDLRNDPPSIGAQD